MTSDFVLTEHDKAQLLWVRFKAYLEARLADVRERNDRMQSEQETAAIRGEIKCLKTLIGLGADRPMTGNED